MKKLSISDICYIGFFTAVITVCAQLSIPMPYGVPMTLQTFAVPLAGVVLGAGKGTLAAVVYVLAGFVGFPVFAGFTGGPGIVLGATGGFVLSFPLMAFTAGIGGSRRNKVFLLFGLLAGSVLNYAIGMFYFAVVMSCGLRTAFLACVLPFIPTALLKVGIVTVCGSSLRMALLRSRISA